MSDKIAPCEDPRCVCETGKKCMFESYTVTKDDRDYPESFERAYSARHPNSARFHEILSSLGELHDRKQADYGKGDDPFANVRSSEEWGVDGWKGAMIRLNDKVKRLQNYARNGTLQNEGVADSFMDIAVYAVIAMVLWEQDQ